MATITHFNSIPDIKPTGWIRLKGVRSFRKYAINRFISAYVLMVREKDELQRKLAAGSFTENYLTLQMLGYKDHEIKTFIKYL